MESKEMVCIVCPMGCKMHVTVNTNAQDGILIVGNKCSRGIDYGIKELTAPTRVLTTTVAITGAVLNRLPVKTSVPISKNLIDRAMTVIDTVEWIAPVALGDVLIKDILNTGVDIIATRSL